MSKIDDMIIKSEDIVHKIGYPLYGGVFYPNEYFGREYKFDELKIDLYDSNPDRKNIHIHIGGNEVLNYHYDEKNIKFIDGKWTELIDVIHEEIPNIIKHRKSKMIKDNSKERELKGLEEYFKYYLECENERPDIFEILNYNLKNHDISINKYTEYVTVTKICSREEEHLPFNRYKVLHDNEEVAQFSGNKFMIFPNMEEAVENYKPGEWTNTFKNVTKQVKRIDKIAAQKEMDKKADQAIKKLNKALNKK